MSRHTRLPARAVSALLPALLLACGGDEDPPTGPDPAEERQLTTLTISPAEHTAASLEEEIEFSATGQDQDGGAMSGLSLSWSATDTEVATINSDGVAMSKTNGETEIVASSEGVADTATLVVAQEVATLAASPDTARLDAPGDTARFTADARDANDQAVVEPGISWEVSDTSVATIDSDGLATAKAEGQVSVTATAVSEVTGEATLRVGDVAVPVLQSISPSPLRESETATISGQNFVADPGENTVMVGALEATVAAATTTSLDITVPSFDCLPARDVEVEVSTSVGSDRSTAALEPDEAPVTLATGEQMIIRDPSEFCLQFPETSASERYLVGVQSLSDVGGSLTSVMLMSEATDGNAAALEAAVSLAAETPRGGRGQEVRVPEWRDAHRRAERRLRSWARRNLRPHQSLPANPTRGAEILRSVSGSAQVGDTVALRVPDAGSTNPCVNYFEIGAEVKVIGERAILVADTANPAGGFTNADYQDMSDRIDDDIFSTQIEYFGTPTDLDGNGRVVIVVTKAVNQGDPNVVGFVLSGDLFPRTVCASSDEGEIFYGKAPDPNGSYGPAYATETARQRMPPLMAHELTHVIQSSRRFAQSDNSMNPVIAEGQATLSEEVVGHSVTGRQPGQNYGFITAFNANGTDEFDWYLDGIVDLIRYYGFESSTTRVAEAPESCGWWREDPSPCLARPLWYGVSWSFLRWVSDQYGPAYPGGEQGLHQDLIGNDVSGPENVADVVGVPLNELMAGWSASLYVDDRIAFPDPALTFASWDLTDIELNLPETAHLQPLEMGFTDWNGFGEVRASSAGYVTLDGSGRPATAVRVRDGADGTLPTFMQMWVVRLQ